MPDELREITVWDYELPTPEALVPAVAPAGATAVIALSEPLPELNACLYAGVGAGLAWTDRRSWTVDDWRSQLEVEGRSTLLLTSEGVPAGYAELDATAADGSVEIAYFGLLPWARGRGLGGFLLTEAARRAWALPGATRVWVHTCELDGEAARPNYERRGFRQFGVRSDLQLVPEALLAASPGRVPPRPEVELRPLDEDAYRVWAEWMVAEYAAEKVANGAWAESEAPALVRSSFLRLLPRGLETPESWILAITAGGVQVGVLWVATDDQPDGRIFIYGLDIEETQRRRGYGRAALAQLDVWAVEHGFRSIGLHVFGTNAGARSLYERVGYVTTDVNMVKELAAR